MEEHQPDVSGGVDQVAILRMLIRYWWLMGLILIAAAGLGLLFANSQPGSYDATAALIVEDSRASTLFEVTDLGRPSTQASERYLADQVEILRSGEIAESASQSLDGEFSARYILGNTTISGDLNSNLIEVKFSAQSPEGAQAGANAVALAYQELRRRQVQETATIALAKVEALLVSIDADIAELDLQIEETRAGDETLQELNRQFEAAQEELNRLRLSRDRLPAGSDERAQANDLIAELLADFSTWEVVLRLSERGSEFENLVAARDAAVAEKATLVARANSIEVDAELAAGGVTLFSEARLPAEPSGISLRVALAASLALGLAAAASLAYYLTLRRISAEGRISPRDVLDAPLLAELPNFELESIPGPTPLLTHPTSVSAEAFRFAASVIEIRGAAAEATSLMVVSAANNAGRTATVANTGLAAAEEGLRVLLIDADFATQDLTRMLVGDVAHRGLTEVIDGASSIDQAAHLIPVGGSRNQHLSLLSRGLKRVEPASYLRSGRAKGFFRLTVKDYDLVLVDGPSLLQVAYGSALARHTDAAVVVVEHGTPTNVLKGLREHLSLVEIPILGYIETKVPTYHGVPVTDASAAAPSLAPDATSKPREEAADPEPQDVGEVADEPSAPDDAVESASTDESEPPIESDDAVESELPVDSDDAVESEPPVGSDGPVESDGRIVEFEVSGEIAVPIGPNASGDSEEAAGADGQVDPEADAPDVDSQEAADPTEEDAEPETVAVANPRPPRKRKRQSDRR